MGDKGDTLSRAATLARRRSSRSSGGSSGAPSDSPENELNDSLETLTAVFPDIRIEVFREMLSQLSEESRLAVCADNIIKDPKKWVKGRRREPEPPGPDGRRPRVPKIETFRSPAYRKAVRALAGEEFRLLSKSTINAVLAEANHSYLEARQTLVDLSSRSWRYMISSLFLRRKAPTAAEARNHPLVIWKSTGRGSIVPTLKATGSAELDRELFDALIAPINAADLASQLASDRALAAQLNLEEAEAAEATYDCACCFATATFEELVTCNAGGHLVCFRCVRNTLNEALFGQGWSGVDADRGTLRCVALEGDRCSGHFPSDHLYRAIMAEPDGADLLRRLDLRLAEHSVLNTGLPLARCPFCDYVEVKDVYLPAPGGELRLRVADILDPSFIFCVGLLPLLYIFVLLIALFGQLRGSAPSQAFEATHAAAVNRHRLRKRGPRFVCREPRCRRASCLDCCRAWADGHHCHEPALVSLRVAVEQAQSMAVKRVCPRCNAGIVKDQGCNKLRCACGYLMCYVCRGGITEADPYKHFCQHLRTPRQACRECDKCFLWEKQDDDLAVHKAKEEAERQWTERQNRQLDGRDREFMRTGVAGRNELLTLKGLVGRMTVPTIEEVFDMVMETVFV